MDLNNRQKSPLPEQPPAGGDWRSQLTKESRRRTLIKIINTLKTCLPFSGQEGLQELQKIAIRFEEMSYTAATDQYDYLKRISSKLNSIESRPNGNTNAMPSNSTGMDRNPQDPAIQNVQPQVQNHDQSLPIPMTYIQKSAVQGVDSDHTNSERPNIQHVSPQQQIHRSQNPQEYIYPQQLRQPLLKQDLHKGVTKQPLTHPQMQSSPLSVVQSLPTMQPSIAPVLQQSQPSSDQRQDQQSVPETQIHEYSQQATVHHQTQMFQQPMLQTQQHRTSISDMQLQQSQRPLGQKNNILIMHQQRLASRSHVGQLPQQQQLLESQSGDGQQQSQQQERMLHMPSQMAQQNDQQKTFGLPAEAPSTLLESAAHNGISSDWQEEVYQKIKVLKEMYFSELAEAHQKICFKLQQLGSLLQHIKTVEKLKYYKKALESLLHYLQVAKNSIQQYHMDKLTSLDKYILKVLGALGARKPGSPMLQRQLPSTHLQSMQKTEQPEEQVPQLESHTGVINSQLQVLNVQGSSAIISSQQKMINPLQSGSNVGLGQGSTPTSIQQNPLSTSHLANTSDSAPHIVMNSVNSNISSLQPASSMLQSQHMKEQHGKQIMQQRGQIKEPFQQHRIHQQLQQTTQKQQQHMQQVKQQHGQLQQMDIKPRPFAQNLSEGKKYPHQQLKPGFSFPNSSLQSPQATSPPIKQQSSPSVVPSSTPLAPSPIPSDPEKHSTMASSVSNATSIIHQQTTLASPLLEELSPSDSHGNTLNSPEKSSVTQQPLERLLKVVKSMSSKTLNASVSDIGSVLSIIDRIGGSAPGEGSRATVDEDLASVTNYHLQARNWMTRDGSIGMKRMRECTNYFSLNATSSVGSPTDSFGLLTGSDLDFAATCCVKRPRIEINPALLEEIRKINECLIDTVVDMCDKDFASEGGEGTFVKCCYNAVTLSPNLKLYYASEEVFPIQPIRLLVPGNYPNCSPVLLNKLPVTFSKEHNDLSSKAYSRLSIALRTVSQPMSLMEIARTWDDCARSVMCDYASLLGGGTFSSKFGTLDKCLSVA